MIDSNNAPPALLTSAAIEAANSNSTSFLSRSSFRLTIPAAIQSITSSFKNESATSDLGTSFQPGEYDIVCGRGKGCYNRTGNKRFRAIVIQHIPEYRSTKTKLDKSILLNRIVEEVRQQNNGNARFVKKDKTKGWFEISDDQARDKVGHAMREAVAAIKNKDEQPTETANKNADQVARHQTELVAQQQQFFSKLLELSGRDISAATSFVPV